MSDSQQGTDGPTPIRLTRAANGDPDIHRIGVPRGTWREIYYFVLIQSWGVFFALLVGFYVLVNSSFATLYALAPGCIAETHPGRWLEDFFFSVETYATVGFGVLHPVTPYAHWVVTIEILCAVLTMPFTTGLVIVKFARPTARVTFSRNAVITRHDGVPTLMFRLANLRDNQIFEAHINLTLLRLEQSAEGRTLRRLVTLTPLRQTHPMFILTWTVMHRIDASSPLFGVDFSAPQNSDLDIMAVMTGLDATTSTTVHARHLYAAADILIDHNLVDIIGYSKDGQVTIDYGRIHEVSADAPAGVAQNP